MLQITTDRALTELGQTIQMALAPVFLFSGVAAFLGVLNMRLSRVIDRTRILDGRDPDDEDERELRNLFHRRAVINWAITLCTICALSVATIVLLMFLGIVVHFAVAKVVVGFFLAAMLTLIIALFLFLHEIRMAISYTRHATRHH